MNKILKKNQLKKTDIFKLCSTFDKKEASKCSIFLAEFTTASKRCRMLYDEIYKYYKKAKYNWNKVDVSISIINKKLTGTSKDNNSSRVLRSELYKNLIKYCSWIELQRKEKGRESMLFLDYLANKKSDELFFKKYNKLEKALRTDDKLKLGADFSFQKYQSYNTFLELIAKDQSKKNQMDYNLNYQNFVNYSILQKIQNYSLILNHNLIKRQEVNIEVESLVDKLFEEGKTIPDIQSSVELYQTACLMLKNDSSQYYKLKFLLDNRQIEISKTDLQILYTFMHNFCVNSKDPKLLDESRINLLKRFDEGFLHDGEYIKLMNAKALCTTILNLTRSLDIKVKIAKDDAELKIKEVINKMSPEHRESTEYFHLAVLDFYFGDYINASKKLKDSPKYANAFFDFDARTILQRCYYSTENIDDFGKSINSFQSALRNDRDLSDKHKKEYLNFTRAISILQKANNVIDKMEKEKLLQKLDDFLQEHPVKVLAWFREQIELLR